MTEVSPEARSAVAVGAVFSTSVVRYSDLLEQGEWSGAIALVRRTHRLQMLDRWWGQGRMSVEDLRALLPNAWLDAEPESELRWWPLFRDAGYCGHPPPEGDPLLVYRGGRLDEPIGMVWVRSLDDARRRALKWPEAETTDRDGRRVLAGVIVTASVPSSAIRAHLVHRSGAEIIAHPRVVTILGRERISEPLI